MTRPAATLELGRRDGRTSWTSGGRGGHVVTVLHRPANEAGGASPWRTRSALRAYRSTRSSSARLPGAGLAGPRLRYGAARRHAVGPRGGLLELRGHPQQQVLAPVGGHQLDADRQTLHAPVQRQRDRRLAGGVEAGRERPRTGWRARSAQRVLGGRRRTCRAQRRHAPAWASAAGRSRRPTTRPPARVTRLARTRRRAGTRPRVRAAHLGQRPGERLHVVSGRSAARSCRTSSAGPVHARRSSAPGTRRCSAASSSTSGYGRSTSWPSDSSSAAGRPRPRRRSRGGRRTGRPAGAS